MVIGCSAGGIMALKEIFKMLTKPISIPIIVVIHRLKNVDSRLDEVLQHSTKVTVKEAEDKEPLAENTIYLTPSNYHLLVERDQTISLSVSELVNFSRPSLDVTFYSVGEVFKENVLGIVLTGANSDGASGLNFIKQQGGETVVQDIQQAQVNVMPQSALIAAPGSRQMKLQEIGKYISKLYS